MYMLHYEVDEEGVMRMRVRCACGNEFDTAISVWAVHNTWAPLFCERCQREKSAQSLYQHWFAETRLEKVNVAG